ncbi:MAG TPA: SPFH domain-containing protein, partial [Streptosporangiaceae bacterium]|nr:SPFH domain-containing protein [Streptosporangiaceae bacterium]
DLELTLTSRDKINTMLRGVLDDASGKWGIRVTRVEIKAIDPPKSVIDAMEKQMRAEREKRAAILNAEGIRQSQILTADGDKQGNILRAEGEKQSAILKAEGQAQAIGTVFQSIHANDPDPKLLAYQYLQTLPQLAQGAGNTVWMIPSEVTTALKALSSAFDVGAGGSGGSGGSVGTGGENGSGRPAGRPALAQQLQSLTGGGPAAVPSQGGSAEALEAAAPGGPAAATAAASAEAAGAVREADEKLAAAVQEAADGTVAADPGPAVP